MDYNKEKNSKDYKFATKFIRSGTMRSNFGETSEALFLNSGYCYNDAITAENRFNGEEPGFVYSRYLNPNLQMLEQRLCDIESQAEACCVLASGMAAVFASMMCLLKTGDHVVANNVLFGSCFYIFKNVLPNYGIDVTFVAGTEKKDWEQAINKKTKLVFIETPANPTLNIVDVSMVSDICKQYQTKLIIDNIFATQLLQKPLELGADIVVYSTTKFIDGGGKTLGGAVLGNTEYIKEILLPFHRHTGPALSPFNAWMILKSLESFSLRMEQHCTNAEEVVKFLSNHNKISIIYPHHKNHPQYELAIKQMNRGGAVISLRLNSTKDKVYQFMDALKMIDISNNLGDSKTLISHPASTTHSSMDEEIKKELQITQDLLRLSVGLEDVSDIISDIEQALDNI